MAEYTVEYTTKEERNIACDEAHTNGYVMLHDDFTKTGGLLTFAEAQPKSDEELAQEALELAANDASHRLSDAEANWNNLSNTDKREIVKDILTCVRLLMTR